MSVIAPSVATLSAILHCGLPPRGDVDPGLVESYLGNGVYHLTFRHRPRGDASAECRAKVASRFCAAFNAYHGWRRGSLAGHDPLGVAGCKFFSRKANVKDVEAFGGLLEDVGANYGLMITNRGFSKTARSRAGGYASEINLDIVPVADLNGYEPSWDICGVCDPGEDHPPPLLNSQNLYMFADRDAGEEVWVEELPCEWCNTLHLRHQKCGAITEIPEGYFGEPVECEGGCGYAFLVNYGPPDGTEDIQVLNEDGKPLGREL